MSSVGDKVPAPRAHSRRGVLKRGLQNPRQGALASETSARKIRARPRPGLLVDLPERIRLDQILGFEHHVELTIGPGATDAGLRPQVMIFVDADVTFRRALELDTRRS